MIFEKKRKTFAVRKQREKKSSSVPVGKRKGGPKEKESFAFETLQMIQVVREQAKITYDNSFDRYQLSRKSNDVWPKLFE